MSGYVYRGSGTDRLAPPPDPPARSTACVLGRHFAYAQYKAGKFIGWACRYCPALRDPGQALWRAP